MEKHGICPQETLLQGAAGLGRGKDLSCATASHAVPSLNLVEFFVLVDSDGQIWEGRSIAACRAALTESWASSPAGICVTSFL